MTDYYEKFGYTKEFLDKMIPKNTNFCMCPTCGLFFNSSAGFDMHRIDDKSGDFGRRCLTTEEMYGKGMFLNKKGRWITREMDRTAVPFTVEKTSQESGGIA